MDITGPDGPGPVLHVTDCFDLRRGGTVLYCPYCHRQAEMRILDRMMHMPALDYAVSACEIWPAVDL